MATFGLISSRSTLQIRVEVQSSAGGTLGENWPTMRIWYVWAKCLGAKPDKLSNRQAAFTASIHTVWVVVHLVTCCPYSKAYPVWESVWR